MSSVYSIIKVNQRELLSRLIYSYDAWITVVSSAHLIIHRGQFQLLKNISSVCAAGIFITLQSLSTGNPDM